MARGHRFSPLIFLLLVVWGCGKSSALEGRVEGISQPPAQAEATQAKFTQAADGMITDRVTGLEWYICPNQDNTWHEAKAWAERLTVAGGGWRLPTMAELKALYQKGASHLHMDPLFQLPGAWVWSGELHNASFAWGFAFYSGLEGWHSVNYGFGRVALAVRSRR